MDLLRTYLRARALESILARHTEGGTRGHDGDVPAFPERSLSPALPAAAALEARSDGRGDLFSLRVGSPCAALAFGASPEDLLRQALGRGTAPARGRDPGGFPTDWARGWVGPVSLPGALMEVMAGIAMALRLRGEPRVALLVDDAAGSGSGDWHEGLNLAVVQQAPLVLVHHEAPGGAAPGGGASMPDRALAYGFRSWTTLDADPLGVLDTCREAVAAARAGEGVQVVAVHSGGPAGPEDLVPALRPEGMDDGALLSLRQEAEAEMAAAFEAVSAEPAPDPGAAGPLGPAGAPGDLPRVRTPRPWG